MPILALMSETCTNLLKQKGHESSDTSGRLYRKYDYYMGDIQDLQFYIF